MTVMGTVRSNQNPVTLVMINSVHNISSYVAQISALIVFYKRSLLQPMDIQSFTIVTMFVLTAPSPAP